MTTTFPVDYTIHALPNSGFTLDNIYTSLVQNLEARLSESVLPVASNNNVDPAESGPWLNNMTWYVWDDKINAFRPSSVIVGNVEIQADPTANRVQQFQNKSGTVALLDDLQERPTRVLLEGLVAIDWDVSNVFQVTLSGKRATSIYMLNAKDGMTVRVLVTNSGTNQVAPTWDSSIQWPGASAPSIAASAPGSAKSMRVVLRKINGVIYGETLTGLTGFEHPPVVTKPAPTGLISM